MTTSPKEIADQMEKVAVHLPPEQLEKLHRLLASERLMRLLIWMEAWDKAAEVGGWIGKVMSWTATGIKKTVSVTVWIIVPILILRMMWIGELTAQDILKWFAK